MANKRKYSEFMQRVDNIVADTEKPSTFQNSLDSDEEDEEATEEKEYEQTYNVVSKEIEDIERETQAPRETETGFTAFNMKEEMEEGHFDKEGHYHWKKEKEIRDNWLDEIDWMKVKAGTPSKHAKEEGLAESSSDEEDDRLYDPNLVYEQICKYLQPGENINKALRRLGKGKKKLTTAERWKKKKDPNASKEDDENTVHITKLTEFANELLTRTGNMDIYEETYEQIKKKLDSAKKTSHPSKHEAELDMFGDDFETKEQSIKDTTKDEEDNDSNSQDKEAGVIQKVKWEFKWSQEDSAKVHGPHTSEEMHAWSQEGFFKKGAWVRKIGQEGEFYNATRIDFEIYCD